MAVPVEMMGEGLAYQGGLAVCAAHGLEALKRAGWFPWLNLHSEGINRAVALGCAIVGAMGVKMAMEGSFIEGSKIVIAFPAISSMFDSAMHVAVSYGIQQGYWRGVVRAGKTEEPPK